jgi:cysteine dioxygenase
LCWNPEQESPIHDHPCDGCWLQVLDGGVREVRYDRQLNRVSQIEYRRGELSYITDNVGYHKVGNPTQTPAVTLHLYAPPFETCKCWHSDEANPSEPSEGKSVNHSEYGILKET